MGLKMTSLEYIFRKMLNENVGLESNLPPGFDSNVFLTLPEFINKSEESEELSEQDPNTMKSVYRNPAYEKYLKDKESKGLDPQIIKFKADAAVDRFLNKMAAGEKSGKGDPFFHSSTLEKVLIKDENGNIIDRDKLIALLSTRPTSILKTESNSKMMKTFAGTITLPKYLGIVADEGAKQLRILNTCPGAKDCIVGCYAGKGGYIMWPSSSERAGRILTFLFNDWKGWKSQVINEINAMARKFKRKIGDARPVVRWHDSGDFFSEQYLDIVHDIARETPDVKHYAYTKSVSMAKSRTAPENFTTRYSYGGHQDKLIDRQTDKFSDIIRFKPDKEKTKNKKSKDAIFVPDDENVDSAKPKETEVYINFKKYYNRVKKDETTQWIPKSPQDLMAFKNEMAKTYNIEVDSIKTFDEVMQIPETRRLKWNVIITPSDPDNAAYRDDVLGIYLLYH